MRNGACRFRPLWSHCKHALSPIASIRRILHCWPLTAPARHSTFPSPVQLRVLALVAGAVAGADRGAGGWVGGWGVGALFAPPNAMGRARLCRRATERRCGRAATRIATQRVAHSIPLRCCAREPQFIYARSPAQSARPCHHRSSDPPRSHYRCWHLPIFISCRTVCPYHTSLVYHHWSPVCNACPFAFSHGSGCTFQILISYHIIFQMPRSIIDRQHSASGCPQQCPTAIITVPSQC